MQDRQRSWPITEVRPGQQDIRWRLSRHGPGGLDFVCLFEAGERLLPLALPEVCDAKIDVSLPHRRGILESESVVLHAPPVRLHRIDVPCAHKVLNHRDLETLSRVQAAETVGKRLAFMPYLQGLGLPAGEA